MPTLNHWQVPESWSTRPRAASAVGKSRATARRSLGEGRTLMSLIRFARSVLRSGVFAAPPTIKPWAAQSKRREDKRQEPLTGLRSPSFDGFHDHRDVQTPCAAGDIERT